MLTIDYNRNGDFYIIIILRGNMRFILVTSPEGGMMRRNKNRDLLILGLGMAGVYLLSRRPPEVAGSGSPVQASPAPGYCDECNLGGAQEAAGSSLVTNSFCPGGWVVREGLCVNPYSEVSRLGSMENDLTLARWNIQIEMANQQQDWDLSWRLASQRDAWVRSVGGT